MTKREQFIDVHCLNTEQCLSVEFGTSLAELLSRLEFTQPYPVTVAPKLQLIIEYIPIC